MHPFIRKKDLIFISWLFTVQTLNYEDKKIYKKKYLFYNHNLGKMFN